MRSFFIFRGKPRAHDCYTRDDSPGEFFRDR